MGGATRETALPTLGFWPPEAVEKLRGCWITTAGQVVAAAAAGGVAPLAEQIGLTESELLRLLELTKEKLSPDVRRELSQPVDASTYATGALPPRDDRQ